ncbi:hypothetical protein [Acidisoma sp. S159]|uniref:hypothetical protein n=1 Tax=Acidisoma sp. S159 TaxID=1747225 RepID=UPI001C206701|nr:hypothetical protein [Acidisoma sp. S159]
MTSALADYKNRKAKGKTAPAPSPAPAATEEALSNRQRAKGATVALTVRVSREDWRRLHDLALDMGVSLQTLAIWGFSALLEEKGLPPIKTY